MNFLSLLRYPLRRGGDEFDGIASYRFFSNFLENIRNTVCVMSGREPSECNMKNNADYCPFGERGSHGELMSTPTGGKYSNQFILLSAIRIVSGVVGRAKPTL